jgi:O-antigen ligase
MNLSLGAATWAIAAAVLPSVLAYNVSPSPTFLNQALAFALWAGLAGAARADDHSTGLSGTGWPLTLALLVITLLTAASFERAALPLTLAVSMVGAILATTVVLSGGHVAAKSAVAGAFLPFACAFFITALLNVAIALIQVFAPTLPDGTFIAHSGLPGRAVGNLRQPNHLSSLLMWGCIATLALLELRRIGVKLATAALAAMVFGVVLTASRTGLVGVFLLAAWGLIDRRLSRPARVLLLAAPVMYAVSWYGMAQWAAAGEGHAFGGATRLSVEGDLSSSRLAIWRDTLTLIAQHPWTGVGVGNFNFAWTLTPLPQRPTAFFDHTHNLPLQLWVEMGLPLGTLVLALLLWALVRGLRNAWRAPGDLGVGQRAAMLMVLMIGLHSLLEYPLWYAYFLLPAAWAWGFALHRHDPAAAGAGASRSPVGASTPGDDASSPLRSRAMAGAAALVVVGTALAVADYSRVAVIFSADEEVPLAQRIEAGRKSVFFGHHADYAAVTSGVAVADPERAFDRATHYLLDTRLMIAWAKALAASGDVDKARHLAARLREFRKPDAEAFFAPCDGAPGDTAAAPASAEATAGVAAQAAAQAAAPAALPFQCQAPQRTYAWTDFLPRR